VCTRRLDPNHCGLCAPNLAGCSASGGFGIGVEASASQSTAALVLASEASVFFFAGKLEGKILKERCLTVRGPDALGPTCVLERQKMGLEQGHRLD